MTYSYLRAIRPKILKKRKIPTTYLMSEVLEYFNKAVRLRVHLCAIQTLFNFCSLYALFDTHNISSTYGGCLHSTRYHQPPIRFVFSISFQWEVLYKIWTILYLIYPKFFKNLKSYIIFSQNRIKFFPKFQLTFKTDKFF